jgi:hypothetical protein
MKMAKGEIIQGELAETSDSDSDSKSILGQMEFYTFDFTKAVPKNPPN